MSELSDQALALPLEDRVALAQRLWYSIEETVPDVAAEEKAAVLFEA